MVDTLNVSGLGKLEIVEIYAYYDEPVLFSCKDTEDKFYLVVAADENDQYETWLYAEVSTERLNLIRSGTIDLHDAFADTEDGSVLQVRFPYDDQTEPHPESVQSNQIPEDMLPTPGECLELEIGTLPLLSNAEEIAKSKNQEILDISLIFAEGSKTEVPILLLSKIFGRLQNVINTIGMTIYNLDRITKDFKYKMQMSLFDTVPGSFNMRFASTEIDQLDLSGYSNCGKVIEVFLKLLKAGNNEKQLKEFLKPLKSGVAKNYTDFLKALNGSVMNTKFKWVSPIPSKGGTVDLSSNQMQEIIKVLEKHHEEIPPPFTVPGKLTGVFLSTKKFEMEMADDETYTGDIADEVFETVSTATISGRYMAEIQEITKRSETTDEVTKTEYRLLSLHEIREEMD